MRWPVALLLLALGCPTPAIYREVQPGLSCERATRVTYRTLVQLGYTVTELVPATLEHGGMVAGTKTQPDGSTTAGRVRISCDREGAVMTPVEEALVPTYDFSRGFGYSFKTLVQRPDVEEPHAERGLQILVHALEPHEAILDLGGVPTVGGAILVRVTVRNHTDRAIAVDPSRIELVGAAGTSAVALAGPALAAALAPGPGGDRVRGEPLRAGRVAARTTVAGFLVYPAGSYREARVGVEDVETEETEGLVIPVE